MDEEVGASAPLDVLLRPERLDLGGRPPLGLVLGDRVGEVVGVAPGLLVGRVYEGPAVVLQAVAEGGDRVVHRVRRHLHAGRLEGLARHHLAELELDRHLVHREREVDRVHLVGESALEGLHRPLWTDHGELRAADEVGSEEGEALDVVPVRVADQEVGVDWALEHVAELADAGPAVDDDQVVVAGPDLDAGGVAAEAKGVAAGGRPGAPGTPELDPHGRG